MLDMSLGTANIVGYQIVRQDRTCYGGGVLLSIRGPINFKPRVDVPTEDLELLCIEVEPPKSKSFLVISWYRPPNSPVATFEKLEKIFIFFDKEGKRSFFWGIQIVILQVKMMTSLPTMTSSTCVVYMSFLVFSSLSQSQL